MLFNDKKRTFIKIHGIEHLKPASDGLMLPRYPMGQWVKGWSGQFHKISQCCDIWFRGVHSVTQSSIIIHNLWNHLLPLLEDRSSVHGIIPLMSRQLNCRDKCKIATGFAHQSYFNFKITYKISIMSSWTKYEIGHHTFLCNRVIFVKFYSTSRNMTLMTVSCFFF